jgi:Tol biopolymer transport system component
VLAAFALAALAGVVGFLAARAGRGEAAPAAALLQPAFRQLTKLPGGEGSPTLSPDGESFVFVKQDGGDLDLFLQRIDGTKAIALTEDCANDDLDPAFSPDGRSIAFRSDCGAGVYVMGVTGESKRRVSDFGYAPAWSPGGHELAIVMERLDAPTTRNTTSTLWVVGIESGERRKVSEHDAMSPTWSSDGRRIAFWGLRDESFQRDLWSVAADGSEVAADKALPLVDDLAVDWAPLYTKDGRWLYFASTRGGTFNLWRFALDAHGTPAGPPQPITAPSSWAGPFSISADGRRILYCDRNTETAIVRAAFDPARRALASAPQPVFSGSFELRDQTLSADGEWVVFANEDQPQQLHLVRTDGSGYRQLTTGNDRNRQGALSPDGSHIVFQTTRGESSLAVVRADGGGWQSIGRLPGAGDPVWSPDGSTVGANSTGSNAAGVLVDVRPGFAAAVVHKLPPPGAGLWFWPGGWSPDGELVSGRAVGDEGLSGPTGLFVYSPASGAYRELPFRHAAPIDNKQAFVDRFHVAYTARNAIWLGDVRGGEPVLLYSAPPGHRVDYLSGTLDGRWLT